MQRYLSFLLPYLLGGLLSAAVAQQAKQAPVPTLPIDPVMQLVTYSDFVPVTGYTQDSLYARARQWFVRTFPPVQPAAIGTPTHDGYVSSPEGEITTHGKEFNAFGWQQQSAVGKQEVGNYRLHFVLQFFVTDDHYECHFNNFLIGPAPSISLLSGNPLIPLETYFDKQDPRTQQYQALIEQYKRHVDAFAKEQLQSLRAAVNRTN